jgi:conjugative relaxase-like TrwC/TraI family protein
MTVKVGGMARDPRYYQPVEPPQAGPEAAWDALRTYGPGAARLGVGPHPTAAEFANILGGQSREGIKKLVQNAHLPDRVKGREVLVSPDQSVAIAASVGSPLQRKSVYAGHAAAVEAVAAEMNRVAGRVRLGRGGKRTVAADLVVFGVTHDRNRRDHPFIHTHLIVCGLAVLPDSHCRAVDNRHLYRAQAGLETLYQRTLYETLKALGVSVELRAGKCVATGIPPSLLAEYSTRSREVRAAKAQYPTGDRRAGQKAAYLTRPPKSRLPAGDLRRRWKETAWRHGYLPAATFTREPTAAEIQQVCGPSGSVPTATHGPAAPSVSATATPAPFRPAPAEPVKISHAPRPKPEARQTPNQTARFEQRPPGKADKTARHAPKARREAAVSRGGSAHGSDIPPPPAWPRTPDRLAAAAVAWAVEDAARTAAHFTATDVSDRVHVVLDAWTRAGHGRATPEHLRAAFDRLAGRPNRYGLVRLTGPGEEPVFAARRQMAQEKVAIKALRRLTRPRRARAPSLDTVRRARAAGLTATQEEAVIGIAYSASGLSLIDGRGRAGKSTALVALDDIYRASGRNVVAVTPTNRGAAALAEAGVASPVMTAAGLNLASKKPGVFRTWNRVFWTIRKQQYPNLNALLKAAETVHREAKEPLVRLGRDTVLLVDDAERIPTAELAPLLARAAKAGATVVLAGDSRGLPPARPAGVFAYATSAHPHTVVDAAGPPTPLTKAVRSLGQGRVPEALTALARGGLLDAGRPGGGPALDRLLAAYAKDGHFAGPSRDALILTPTAAAARTVNRRVQRLRAKAGLLGPQAAAVAGGRVWAGDRVVATRTDRAAGVHAGRFGTVRRVGVAGVEVELDGGGLVRFPRGNPPLRLGYAADPVTARGRDLAHGYVLAGRRPPDRDQLLAMLARPTETAVVFADRSDIESGRFAQTLGQPRRPGMAHAVAPKPPEPRPVPNPQHVPGY